MQKLESFYFSWVPLLVLAKTVIVLVEYKHLHAIRVHGEKKFNVKCQITKKQQNTTLL